MVPHNRQVCKCIVQVDKSPLPRETQFEGTCRVYSKTSAGLFLEQVPPDFSASDGLKEGID